MRGFFFHRGQGCGPDRYHGHRDGFGRGFAGPFGGREGMGRGFGRFGGRGDSRGFGHGGLRLVLLRLIADKPSHGYELIKEIEERSGGAYAPSPGVIYPTLNWLEDEGFITVTPGEDGRKQAAVTDAGQAHLAENAAQVDDLFARMNGERTEHGNYAPLMRAMHNLKAAVRLRGMKPLSQDEIHAIADMLDETAKKIERS